MHEGGLTTPERRTSVPELTGNFCPALTLRTNGLEDPEHWP